MKSPETFLEQLRQLIVWNRQTEIARSILAYPDPRSLSTVQDADRKNILFRAIEQPNQEQCLKTIIHLVNHGANPLHESIDVQTILFYASRDEKQTVVQYLLDNFQFKLNKDDFSQQTPLFYSARFNRGIHVSQLLLKAGCDPNHKDKYKQTCLFWAAGSGNLPLCQLLFDYGVNVAAVDVNRQRAIAYARKKQQYHVVQYLNSCQHHLKRVRDEQKIRNQESSQQSISYSRPKKKDQVSEYALLYTNQNGETKMLSPQQLEEFRQASPDNAKLIQLMRNPNSHVEGLPPASDRRFQKIALKILNYFWRLQNAYHFYDPVNWVALRIPDYPTIIKYPMDFGTVKRKLAHNAYQNQLQFQEDMNLVFDNCILYNGQQRDLGKIALQMKMQFNTMFVKQYSG